MTGYVLMFFMALAFTGHNFVNAKNVTHNHQDSLHSKSVDLGEVSSGGKELNTLATSQDINRFSGRHNAMYVNFVGKKCKYILIK